MLGEQIHGEQSPSHGVGGKKERKKERKKESVLFVELWTCHAFFLLFVIVGFSTAVIVALVVDHNCKSNFCHLYDSRDSHKSWVLVSLLL
jgi:hypothetical protein